MGQAHTQPTERFSPQQLGFHRLPSRRRLTLVSLMIVGVAFIVFMTFTSPFIALLLAFGAGCVWMVGFIFVML